MIEHNKDYNAYKCKICGNQVKNLQTFQNHLNTHKETRIKHMCEICGLEYTTSRQLQVGSTVKIRFKKDFGSPTRFS